MRPGAGFRVALEAEGRPVGTRQALQGAVEQRHMRGPQVGRQRRFVHREAVVLAGDGHAAGVQVLHRVVGAVVAELHLEGLGARRQRQDLVAQADAEGGDATVDQLPRGLDRVVAGFRVARAVGQEDAVRLQCQGRFGRGARRHHGDAAAAAGQHAQDVALDAEVVGHHVPARIRQFAITSAQAPFGLRPRVGGVHRHHLGQVEAAHAGGGSGPRHGLGNLALVDHGARLEGDDAPVLCATGAQDAGQTPRVDAGDGDDALGTQVVRQAAGAAEVGRPQRQVLDHQAGGVGPGRLDVLVIDAVAADVRIGQGDDLPAIAGVGQDLLVAGQGGVEHHFADGMAGSAHGVANEMRAVCKGQQRGGQDGKQGAAPGFAGSAPPAAGPRGHRDSATDPGGLGRAVGSAGLRPNCIRCPVTPVCRGAGPGSALGHEGNGGETRVKQ